MMHRKSMANILFTSIFSCFLLVGCGQFQKSTEIIQYSALSNTETVAEEVQTVEKKSTKEEHLLDNKELYKDDDDYSVITMYLTVSQGNASDGSNHTWQEVNTYSVYDYQKMGVDRYKVEGLLQIDEKGDGLSKDSFGYGETVPNVSVQIRGQTSSRRTQKNYKVRIKDGKGSFRGQRTLDLNKHAGDPHRFTNKLAYDLLKTVPQLVGGRTQFVHLYVKDNTISEDKEYEDYGLYTMVEQVNKTFFKNHKLDENGQLYKVTFFEWNKYEEVMMDQDDPEFDQTKFDRYLESKGNSDHSKLREVINEVNNYSIPIDKVVEEHFDAENICYWMAFNILIGNYDCGARNLFIYSPLNSKKFYMICWDMDAAYKRKYYEYIGRSEGLSWERGMTQFLGLKLTNRMMKEDKYRSMLSEAVDDLYKHYVSPDIVNARVKNYQEVIKPLVFSLPDYEYLVISEEAIYDELVSYLGDETKDNYETFKESMKYPWPFYVDIPMIDEKQNKTIVTWDTSYEYHNENVTYDYVLATDYNFENVISEGYGLTSPSADIQVLGPGDYYLKVVATNESGYTIDCFDYLDGDDGKVYGCLGFKVNADKTVEPI